jgi:hypothetical protein
VPRNRKNIKEIKNSCASRTNLLDNRTNESYKRCVNDQQQPTTQPTQQRAGEVSTSPASRPDKIDLSNAICQEWDKQKILNLIETGNRIILYKMLRALYDRQTWTERAAQTTADHNRMGFNAFDAPFLSSVAEQAERYKTLTPGQAGPVARRLRKYAAQLAEIANQNESNRLKTQPER